MSRILAYSCHYSASLLDLPVARKCCRGLLLLLRVRSEHLGSHRDRAAILPLPQEITDAVTLS